MFFRATIRVVGHEAFENESYIVTKAHKFTVFEILREFFLYIMCPCIPTYRVYRLSNKILQLLQV